MICDIINIILVILVLRQEVSSQLMIEGIPNKANHGDVYRLRCSDTTVWRFWRVWRFGRRWGLWGKAQFNRNFNHKVTVDAGISWCEVDEDDDVYGCEATLTSITLIIKNINSARDNNTHWSCRGFDEKHSNNYTIFVKTVPVSCKLTTTITHIMKNTGNGGDDGDHGDHDENNEDDGDHDENNEDDGDDGDHDENNVDVGDDAGHVENDEDDDGDAGHVQNDEDVGDDAGDDEYDVSNKFVLNEGDDLTLNCSSPTTNISYKWEIFVDYNQSRLINNQSIYFMSNITRRDAGMYVCTGSSGPDCDESDVVYVRVQYPLSLNITIYYTSETVELICRVVGGYPTNYTMNNWRHYIDGQFVREIEGVTTDDITVLVLNNTLLNEGTYVCNASNGIKDFKGTIHQTDQTYINIVAPPIILEVSNASETRVGTEVEIKAAFIIGGDVLNITWYQQQQNSSTIAEVLVDTKSEYGIRPVNIYGAVINKNITILSGSVPISKMVDLTVTVCNEYGCTYLYQLVTVLPEITSSTVSVDTGKASTDGLISSTSEFSENVPLIAGGVVGAVVLIGLIIFVIIVVRRRSNYNTKSAGTARQNPPNSFRYRNPTYDTSQDQQILENDLYISGDDDPTPNKVDHTDNNQMEIMENDLYISADDDTNLRGTGLKDGEMEILENDLYISADDDDKNTDGVETKPEMEILENDLYIPLEIDTRVF